MTLPTNWVDSPGSPSTLHASDVNSMNTQSNNTANAVPAGQIAGETSTATAAGTTTLTIASPMVQKFTGTTTQTVVLPTTSVVAGNAWLINNASTGSITVNASGGATVLVIASNTVGVFTANTATPTTAAGWDVQYGGIQLVSGKSFSVYNTMTMAAFDGASFAFGGTPTVVTAASAAVTTTQTVAASYTIPANSLSVGQTFQLETFGTQSTTSGSCSFYLYIGTAGTSLDTQICSATANVGASGGNTTNGMVTVRTIGSSGTCIGGLVAVGSSVLAGNVTSTTTNATVNTTVQNILTYQVKVGAGSHTVQQAVISGIPA